MDDATRGSVSLWAHGPGALSLCAACSGRMNDGYQTRKSRWLTSRLYYTGGEGLHS